MLDVYSLSCTLPYTCICTGPWPSCECSCPFLTWYQMLRFLSRSRTLAAPCLAPPSPASLYLVAGAGHLLPRPRLSPSPPPRRLAPACATPSSAAACRRCPAPPRARPRPAVAASCCPAPSRARPRPAATSPRLPAPCRPWPPPAAAGAAQSRPLPRSPSPPLPPSGLDRASASPIPIWIGVSCSS